MAQQNSPLRQFFLGPRGRVQVLAGLVGTLLVVIGALLDVTQFWGVLLVGLGVSLIAPALFAFLTVQRDDFVEQLVEGGIDEVFANRRAHFPDEYWASLIRSATHTVRILGVANHGWIRDETEKERTRAAFFEAVVTKKVQTEILWLDPEARFALRREQEENRATRRDTAASIQWFWEFRDTLPVEARDRLVLKEYRSLPTCGIVWVDERMVITHYVAGERNKQAPGMVLSTTRPRRFGGVVKPKPGQPSVTAAYAANYREISDAYAGKVTVARIATLAQRAPAWISELPSEADLEVQGPDATDGDAQ